MPGWFCLELLWHPTALCSLNRSYLCGTSSCRLTLMLQ